MALKKHLYLIGYRGCGKTTVGHMLASRLGCAVVDTDEVIERDAGRSISEIFSTQGESGFREAEQAAIERTARHSIPQVIALGGGAILRESNRQIIRRTGRCVWLQGSAETLYRRIVGDATTAARRPNLSSRGGYEEVVEILTARQPLYREIADFTINTDQLPPDEIVAEIADWLNSTGGDD